MNKKHNILLPDLSFFPGKSSRSIVAIGDYSKCLLALPVFYDSTSVVCDNDLLSEKVSHIIADPPFVANKNGGLTGMFLVDDHIFMIVNTDTPAKNAHHWVPYYSQYVSGFFVLCHRHSTARIFNDCKIPTFPLSIKSDPSVPLLSFEHDAHSKSMTIKKDISVFFHGRYGTRLPRKFLAEIIQKHITDVYIQDSGDRKSLPGSEYVDLMSRSKIVWCPRSVRCPKDSDCNAACPRESEAMCLECLVIRPSIGITETEDRISGVHFVEIQNDSSDLIEKLQYYLDHDDERKEIAHNGRLWWERNCSVIARAKQIYSDCLEAIGGTNA